jgi:DNA-binding response OmpR family regulator
VLVPLGGAAGVRAIPRVASCPPPIATGGKEPSSSASRRGKSAADAPRVLLLHEDDATGETWRTRLVTEGFAVTWVRTFAQAASSLVAGSVDLLLVSLPETAWVRNVILAEIRNTLPSLPVVALAPTISNELTQVLTRLHVATVLSARCSWQDLRAAIHAELGGPNRQPSIHLR